MRFTQDGPVRTIRCMLDIYRTEAAERAAIGIPPLPLTAAQVIGLIRQLTAGTGAETLTLLDLLTHPVSPGVDDAAAVKAEFLATVARGEISAPPIGAPDAVALLGTMLGGYNVAPLVELLDNPSLGGVAAAQLAGTLLVFDAFHDVRPGRSRGTRTPSRSCGPGLRRTGSPVAQSCPRDPSDGVQGQRRGQHR